MKDDSKTETKNISQALEGVKMSEWHARCIQEFLNTESNFSQLKENILELLFLKLLIKEEELTNWEQHVTTWLTKIYKGSFNQKIFPKFLELIVYATQHAMGMNQEEIKKLFLNFTEERTAREYSYWTTSAHPILEKIIQEYRTNHPSFTISLQECPKGISSELDETFKKVLSAIDQRARIKASIFLIPLSLVLMQTYLVDMGDIISFICLIVAIICIIILIREIYKTIKGSSKTYLGLSANESAEETKKARNELVNSALSNSLVINLQKDKVANKQVICTIVARQDTPIQQPSLPAEIKSESGFTYLSNEFGSKEAKAMIRDAKNPAASLSDDDESWSEVELAPYSTSLNFTKELIPHELARETSAHYDPKPDEKCTMFDVRGTHYESYIFINPLLEREMNPDLLEGFRSLHTHTKIARDRGDQGIKILSDQTIIDPGTGEKHIFVELKILKSQTSHKRLVGTFITLPKPNGVQCTVFIFNTFWDGKPASQPKKLSLPLRFDSKPATYTASRSNFNPSFTETMGRKNKGGTTEQPPKQERKKNSKR